MENALIAITGFLATLAAAFFGSRYAFTLQESKSIQAEKLRQSTTGNLTIFRLTKVHNELYALKNQTITPHIDNPARHFLIKPPATSPEPLTLDLDSLAFLFETDHLNLAGELHALQLQIKTLTTVITRRSDIYQTKYLPAAEKLGLAQGQLTTSEEIEAAIGYRYTHTLKEYTDIMIRDTDNNILLLREYIEKLNAIFRELYPQHKIIKVNFDKE